MISDPGDDLTISGVDWPQTGQLDPVVLEVDADELPYTEPVTDCCPDAIHDCVTRISLC